MSITKVRIRLHIKVLTQVSIVAKRVPVYFMLFTCKLLIFRQEKRQINLIIMTWRLRKSDIQLINYLDYVAEQTGLKIALKKGFLTPRAI